MTEKIKIDLGNVQKTMFLPLWGRAQESLKKKPMLVDETAVRIMDQIDYDFSSIAQNMDELSQIAWIKRSLLCDKICMEFLLRYPAGTIVNLGCGLDTTFERVDNGLLVWYDLDLPDVIALRSKFIQEGERRIFLPISFLDESWMEKIKVNGNVLFLAAGVVYFFEEGTIKELFLRLLNRFPRSEVFFDVSSPMGVKVANKKVMDSSGLDEKSHLIWGVNHIDEILAWDPRIKLIKIYFYFRSGVRGLRNKMMGMLSDYLKIQYMVHLRLGK
jgi:O-methyltransferase involved in polyketide biosynthesis